MSTINATNVQATNVQDTAGANSSTTAQLTSGRAKAWVNYDHDSNTLTDSFNVSGVTDDSAGNFTVSFTTNFSNTNYIHTLGHGANASYIWHSKSSTRAVGTCSFTTSRQYLGYAPVAEDTSEGIYAVFYGDQ